MSETEQNIQYFLEKANRLCLAELPNWNTEHENAAKRDRHKLASSVVAMLMKLLCATLPNLERLCHNSWYSLNYQNIFDPTATDRSGLLPSLKELRLEWEDEKYGMSLEEISGFLVAPNLERLHLFQVDGLDSSVQLPVSHSVRHLRLTNVCLEAAQFTALIAAFPSLTQLEYHAGGAMVAEGGTDELGASACITALQSLAGQLEYLLLDFAQQFETDDMGETRVSSLKHFKALTELCIESEMIMPQTKERMGSEPPESEITAKKDNFFLEYFPTTLTSLRITHLYRNTERPLIELAKNVNDWLPELTQIQLDFGCGEMADRYYGHEDVSSDEKLKLQLDTEFGVNQSQTKVQKKGDLKTSLNENDRVKSRDTRIAVTELEDHEGNKIEIPTQFVVGDYNRSFDEYLIKGAQVRHLPQVWQDIVSNFNSAGVRVKLGCSKFQPFPKDLYLEHPFQSWMSLHEPEPVVKFDGPEQLAKLAWSPNKSLYFYS